MSKEILNLEPKAIWKHFYSLTQIPRPSKHEEAIQDFMVNFGKNLGLETIKDEVGNVIIRKPATPGMEDRKGIVLQGHLDMVPQKNSDKQHDFTKDPIDALIDGEWVRANGTTLGADNGMGVAAAMSILEAKDLVHGPIEALFTCDEETGMTGAFGLKAGILKGDILINMDSEDEGELYIGCAGGTNANAEFSYTTVAVPAGTKAFELALTGLKGGHSGVDIALQRGNSNKLLNRFLRSAAQKFGLRLASIDGGSLRNAIPRESFATVVVPADMADEFVASLSKCEAVMKAELEKTEPFMTFKVKEVDLPASLIDEATQTALLNAVYACPNGVIRMSDSMSGLVETSNNLAIVKSGEGKIKVLCLIRSSVDSGKKDLENMIESVFQLAGAAIWMDGQYPGWKPNVDSPILKTMSSIYNNRFGKIPEIRAIHAGLECGLLGGVYPNWDMISFGPTIRFPHSPDEKVNIESVQKFWDFTLETLKNVPKK
ncbi:MAG TPA: cytosol nonspecific dipeptidase [Bacteroidales bacterium]|nr:cytosol nonspecific dipeptidase [Bacteroidales bacterium]